MTRRFRTYTAFSISCALVWAVILVVRLSIGSKDARHALLLVFFGWWLGWLAATIARVVYPPPKSRRSFDPNTGGS